MARPRKYEHDIIAEKFNVYIDSVDLPLVEEFCVNENINKDTFYRMVNESSQGYFSGEKGANVELSSLLSDAKKRADAKAEVYLVSNASRNKINPVFSMFMLKQARFGWKDKQEHELTGKDGGDIVITVKTPEQLEQRINELQAKMGIG